MGDKKKVAVLMGGTSHERVTSLASGQNICRALEEAGYEVLPLDTTKDLTQVLRMEQVDCVYIALHGKHGEDGTIQSVLELLGIPYVGTCGDRARNTWNKAALASSLAAYRNAAGASSNSLVNSACAPKSIRLNEDAFSVMGAAHALDLIPHKLGGFPLCVKPVRQGSAYGVSRVEDLSELAPAMLKAFSYDDAVLVEPWIEGVELALSIVGEGEDAYCLPAVEIVPHKGHLYDTEARQDEDLVDYYAPVRLESLAQDASEAEAILSEIERAALEVHEAFACRDLSRVDLIWDGAKAQILELDISPGMTDLSLFPMALKAANMSLSELLSELVEGAIARKSDYCR